MIASQAECVGGPWTGADTGEDETYQQQVIGMVNLGDRVVAHLE